MLPDNIITFPKEAMSGPLVNRPIATVYFPEPKGLDKSSAQACRLLDYIKQHPGMLVKNVKQTTGWRAVAQIYQPPYGN